MAKIVHRIWGENFIGGSGLLAAGKTFRGRFLSGEAFEIYITGLEIERQFAPPGNDGRPTYRSRAGLSFRCPPLSAKKWPFVALAEDTLVLETFFRLIDEHVEPESWEQVFDEDDAAEF